MIYLQKNGTYVEKYTAGHLYNEFILIYESMIACWWKVWKNADGRTDEQTDIATA